MIRFLLRMWQRNKDRKKKTVASESTAINPSNATTIRLTDMNDDCLEHIFLYLSLEDLLNIADTNKQLKPAAELTFAKRFKRGKLISNYYNSSEIHINGTERVKVRNPYRLLRCFGHLIPKQTIRNRTLLKYVNQYCSESIIEIDTTYQPKYIAVHFPHLNRVNIGSSSNVYGAECFLKMLRLNPQIQHLYLNPGIDDVRLLRTANQFLQFLEHLHLSYVKNSFRNFEEKFVNFANLKVLIIHHYGDIITQIPVSSSCLEAFSFQLHATQCTDCLNAEVDILLEFLRKHPFTTKLTLSSVCKEMRTINRLEEIIEAVSSMEEINISLIKNLSVNDAIKFVYKCKSLKKLSFRADDNSIFDHLNAKLEVKWHVMIEKLNESNMFDITIVRRYT